MFRAAKLTKNADLDKYGCNGYGIEFDARSQLSLSSDEWDKNVVIFGVDSSLLVHVDNREKISQVFMKDREMDYMILQLQKRFNILLTSLIPKRKFVPVYTKMQPIVALNGNGVKMYQIKAKDSEIKKHPLCLRNISEDFTVDIMKQNMLNRYIFQFLHQLPLMLTILKY